MKLKTVIAATALAAAAGSFAMMVQAAEPTEASLMSQVKVSKADARKIALATVPSGAVKSVELEQEHDALVWSFDIAKPGTRNIHEVLVNAKTGKIVAAEVENPADQQKEEAADKLEQAHKH